MIKSYKFEKNDTPPATTLSYDFFFLANGYQTLGSTQTREFTHLIQVDLCANSFFGGI